MEQLKLQYIEGIYQTKALLIHEEPFLLSSGKKSHVYLDHRHFLTNPKYLRLIAEMYHEMCLSIPQSFILGSVDSVMSPFIVGAMNALYHHRYVVMQKKAITPNTKELIYNNVKNNIVLIDDMTSTGTTLIEAADHIRAQGGTVQYAVISASRDHLAKQNLEKNNIQLLNITHFEEIVRLLYPFFTAREKRIIETYPLIIE